MKIENIFLFKINHFPKTIWDFLEFFDLCSLIYYQIAEVVGVASISSRVRAYEREMN